MVFTGARVIVFIDGDFWHGWRFSTWCVRLSPYWFEKIQRNRARDRKNFQTLRRRGWRVLRIWEHQITSDVNSCVDRIESLVTSLPARPQRKGRRSPTVKPTPKRDSR